MIGLRIFLLKFQENPSSHITSQSQITVHRILKSTMFNLQTTILFSLLVSGVNSFGIVSTCRSNAAGAGIPLTFCPKSVSSPASTTALFMSSGFLLNESTRQQLVDVINKFVDIPLIGEEMEGEIIGKAVDAVLDCIEEVMSGEGSEDGERSIGDAQDKLVGLINDNVDLFGLSEEQEGALIAGVVEQLFELFPDAKAQVPM